MRLAHIADVHLGYRAYTRLNPEGVNQREEDVLRAFESVLVDLSDRNVDLIVIAGDLFHTVRPSNLVIQRTFRLFSRFRKHYDTPVVIIGGNHDTPKSADVGCILDLFRDVFEGVYVRHHGFEGLAFEGLGCSVFCLPYFALQERNTQVRPARGKSTNFLAVHGVLRGAMPQAHDPVELDPGELYFDEWNYVALGHYHVRSRIAENCYYAGAPEYTSTNIWEESSGPAKGYIIYDTNTREVEVHETPSLRAVHDLAPVAAADLGPGEVLERIESRLASLGDLEGRIARVVVSDIPREVQRELAWPRIRELKGQALHLDLVLRPPARPGHAGGDGKPGAGRSLEEEWVEFAGSIQGLPHGVDRERLSQLGSAYLAQTAESEVAA